MYLNLTLNRRSESEKRKTELVDVLESVSYQLCGEDDISVDVFYEVTLHSGPTPLLRGFSRKNIFCQKIFDNFFSFQATEMVLTSKWGRIQQEIQI